MTESRNPYARPQGRFRWLALVSGSVALAMVVTGCAEPESQASPDGPELVPNTTAYRLAFPAQKTFTDAYERVLFEGSRGAKLESVEILGGDGYFELVGVQVAGSERKIGSIQFAPNYPPRRAILGPLVEGEGAYLAPGDLGSLLLVGMKITRDDIGMRAGLRVNYSIGGEMYYTDHPAAVVNCPPGSDSSKCDAAFEEAFDLADELRT